MFIRELYKTEGPRLEKLTTNCTLQLDKYMRLAGHDLQFKERVLSTIKAADDWYKIVWSRWKDDELYNVSTQGNSSANIGVFSANGELTIYDFLERFENYCCGTTSVRADKLYSDHLSPQIKAKIPHLRMNLHGIKQYLITEFGRMEIIVEQIFSELERNRVSPNCTIVQRQSILASMTNCMTKLIGLSSVKELVYSEVLVYFSSHSFIAKLRSVLPEKDAIDFVVKLGEKGLNPHHVSGMAAFTVLQDYCRHVADALESAIPSIEKSVNRGRTVHGVYERSHVQPYPNVALGHRTHGSSNVNRVVDPISTNTANRSHDSLNVNRSNPSNSGKPGNRSFLSSNTKQPSPKPTASIYKPWWDHGLKYPCGISGHGSHEVHDCIDFFTMTPSQRRHDVAWKRSCRNCLQPTFVCSPGKSKCPHTIPDVLVCKGCTGSANDKMMTAPNILFCSFDSPLHPKPSRDEVIQALTEYLGFLNPSITSTRLAIAACFQEKPTNVCSCAATIVCSCNTTTKTSKPTLNSKTPTIDTTTGVKIDVPESFITKDSLDSCCYIMQHFQIGSSSVLGFYDKGANICLVEGAMAEKEGLQITSDRPTTMRLAGSATVVTEYGKYRFRLGPTDSGKYHEIECQGISSVTTNFPRYPLHEINNEVRSMPGMNTVNLPEYIGGSKVRLLIGINAPELDPVRLLVLPSGLGVYRATLTDIFGSNICYGGPHHVFSRLDVNLGPMSATVLFAREVEMYRQSIFGNSGIALLPREDIDELSEIQYSIPIKGSRLKVNPTPLTRRDFDIGGCDFSSESEDDVEDEMSSMSYCHCVTKSVHKANIPIARLRELVDADDVGELVSYRCPSCAKCLECKSSDKTKCLTLQESVEQKIIEQSVEVDILNKLVKVDLPFLKEPVAFMTEKHRSQDNYHQALRVYHSQCKKRETVKVGMRLVHSELVEKDFMCKLKDLSCEKQQIIEKSGFRHFYLWRTVCKEDSISTPVRMVVDPTMSHLNLILAKGENMLGRILNIIIANRAAPYVWTSDISKLYNMLHLKDGALPYSLFLFHESLELQTKPEVWCMLRAWYGVVPTGNQASYAIDQLVDKFKETYPMAVQPLQDCRYVDDIASGASSSEDREKQIAQSTYVLGQGGFKLKFIVRSGERPCEKASSDGVSMKMLGYKWCPEADLYSPGLGELNFARKKRGLKAPNAFPVITREDAERLLQSVIITRRIVVAKVAEFYDPCGLYEPIKLQMKLELSLLNSRSWEDPLNQEEQSSWRSRFINYIDYPSIVAKRSVIDKDSGEKPIRLIGLADAGQNAGGAVIYAGTEQPDGTFSCCMLASKSRLMKGTVPRNELNALMLLTELVFIAKQSIGSRVKEILYLTDSTVALAWCQSSSGKRLRIFVNNRVETIKRMIEWTLDISDGSDGRTLPLFHVSGVENIADLLTKPHSIMPEDITLGSSWESGLEWMKLPTLELPITKYNQLQVSSEVSNLAETECFDEPFLLSENLEGSSYMVQNQEDPEQLVCVQEIDQSINDVSCHAVLVEPSNRNLLVDPIKNGWAKTIRILSMIIKFTVRLMHGSNTRNGCHSRGECIECKYGVNFLGKIDEYTSMAENYLFRRESVVISKMTTEKDKAKLLLKDNIYFYVSRLTEDHPFTYRDLEKGIPYYDGGGFTGVLPVVLADSPTLHSYILYVHLVIAPHTGVEFTMREIAKKMMVRVGLRRLVRNVRRDCTQCRRLLLRTIELEMSKHTAARTIISPPFYNCMMDIAYNFPGVPYKNARKSIKLYALVIVCLLTSATSILVLEGLETQDVCGAIERHSCRYGIPACIFIDQGTQLKALAKASFSSRSLETMLVDRLDVRIVVGQAKAHNERGRVENKIKIMRETLEQLGQRSNHPQTAVQWETLFSLIANQVDNTPLAKGNASNGSDLGFDILTANRIKLGRNNYRAMHGSGVDLHMSANLSRLLERNQELYEFWYKSYIDNIHQFALKPSKWPRSDELPVVGDVVLFVFKEDPTYSKKYADWKLGRVVVVETRMIAVEYVSGVRRSGETVKRNLQRNPRDVVVLLGAEELAINSANYFSRLLTSQVPDNNKE